MKKRHKKAQKVAASPPPSSTIIEYLLDETGSMSSCLEPTIAGFNQYVAKQRDGLDRCMLTLTKFDTGGYRTPYTDLDIKFVPDLTKETYIPGSGTNLYDAIAHRIVELGSRIQGQNWTHQPNVLFVIMTDGGDNSSHKHNPASVRELIVAKENLGWSFVYLGANQDAWEIGQRFGMTKGNTMTYDTAKMAQTMNTLASATKAYRAERSSNVRARATTERHFFAPDENGGN